MEYKLAGCFLIYSAFYIAGVTIRLRHNERIRQYEVFLFILSDIVNRLEYAPSEVKELLSALTNEKNAPFNKSFGKMLSRLDNGECDFPSIWQEEIEINTKIINTLPDSMNFYAETGRAFSSGQRNAIISRLKVIAQGLTDEMSRLKGSGKTCAEMYTRLVKTAGVLLIVLIM